MTPLVALMGRLTYARKFLLVGLVLLAPAAFALHAYWASQGATIEFARAERAGVRYVVPANRLVVKLTAARSVAVRAAAGDASAAAALPDATAQVRAAAGAVDRADAASIGVTGVWKKARPVILAAAVDKPAASPQAAFKAYEPAAAAALDLVVQAGNGSNLILDPDLDSYYVMDALVTKLPGIADSAGRAAGLKVFATTMDDRIALAEAQGALQSTVAANRAGLATAFAKTADGALKPALASKLAAVDQGSPAAVDTMETAAAPRLDALLVARMHKYGAARDRVALV